MIARYVLSNKEVVETLICPELLFKEDSSYKELEISFYDEKFLVKIEKDDNGKFFFFHNEKIYLTNYSSKSFEEIFNIILHNPNDLTKNDLYWSLLNHYNDYYFLMDAPLKDFFSYKLNLKETMKVICKLDLNGKYKKEDWAYKVSFKPSNENATNIFSIKDFYFNDFVSSIKMMDIILLRKDEVYKMYEDYFLMQNKKNVLNKREGKIIVI